MPARLTLTLVIVGLLAVPSAASAATKHGISPLAPKAGSSIPAGKRPTMKMRVRGPGQVWVHVCRSKAKDADGLICSDEAIRRARKKSGIFRVKLPFFDFPEFWLNSPGTYYWQAHRISCNAAITDCRQEGPTVKFRVAG